VSVSLLCIDELGIEAYPEVLVELMLQRWTAGLLTLSASNLSVEEFIARYLSRAGERLADRLTQQRHRGLRTFVKATWASYRGAEGRL
jgi:DNA replication protein DnaC